MVSIELEPLFPKRSLSSPVAGRGTPFQGPQGGSCLTLGNELSEETHKLTKQKTTGEGHLGREQEGKGTQEDSLATWLAVSGFMEME